MTAWLAALLGLALACDPTYTYVIEPGFTGPVVVLWGDPKGAALGASRVVRVPRDGKAFVRDSAAESYNISFVLDDATRSKASVTGLEDYRMTGTDCGGQPGPAVAYDSFVIGTSETAAEPRRRELRRDALVETMKRRGFPAVADCWAKTPLPFFGTQGVFTGKVLKVDPEGGVR